MLLKGLLEKKGAHKECIWVEIAEIDMEASTYVPAIDIKQVPDVSVEYTLTRDVYESLRLEMWTHVHTPFVQRDVRLMHCFRTISKFENEF